MARLGRRGPKRPSSAIPAEALRWTASPAWWASHLLLPGAPLLPSNTAATLCFPLPEVDLVLDITSYSADLSLVVDGVAAQLGWDDDGHWHPHVLRPQELLAICGHVARSEPWSAHRALPLAFLHRFAVAADEGGLQLLEAAVEPALLAVGLDRQQTAETLRLRDMRPGTRVGADTVVGPGWVRDEVVGWRLDVYWSTELQREGAAAPTAPFSLRRPDNRGFPGAALMRTFEALGLRA